MAGPKNQTAKPLSATGAGIRKNPPRGANEAGRKALQARIAHMDSSTPEKKAEKSAAEAELDEMEGVEEENNEIEDIKTEEDSLFLQNPTEPARGLSETTPLNSGNGEPVQPGTKPNIVVTDNDDSKPPSHEDPEDVADLADVLAQLGVGNSYVDDSGLEAVGWTTGGMGQKQIILRDGPPNAARYRVMPQNQFPTTITQDKKMNLRNYRPGEEKVDGEWVVKKGTPLTIQGVAWIYPNNHDCPIQLLNPDNWPIANGKNAGTKRSPFTLIRVKLETETGFVRSWETRSTVRRILGNARTTLSKDLVIGESVLVPKAQTIGIADAAIIIGAKFCEIRYGEWVKKERRSLDRSPSPNPEADIVHGNMAKL
ncbi:uncharacterized protein PG986_014388 [Apiospora aurea]|uniref:Uncharacterized protein n=1 Tax=Apiospora aurea TaxID=335848 RepID=A0ABR1PSU7_9PEZI